MKKPKPSENIEIKKNTPRFHKGYFLNRIMVRRTNLQLYFPNIMETPIDAPIVLSCLRTAGRTLTSEVFTVSL